MMSGMTLTWPVRGTPRGTVVLLHGLMARAATWWRIGPALAERGWHTSAVDLPGHGSAPRLPGAVDLDGFAAALAERLPDRVDLLVGHSLGAVTALVRAAPVPVLVLAAARDSALRGDREAVRDLLPAGRFVELAGGHCLHRDQPAQWLAAVSAFADAAL